MRIGAAALAFLAAVLAPGASARAQDDAMIEARIEQGREARRAGRLDEARARFEEALALGGGARAHVQIAATEDAADRPVDALLALRRALATPDDPYLREHRAEIEAHLARIAARVGQLDVRGPDGARIRVGGRDAGALPFASPFPVAPGPIRVTIEGDPAVTLDVVAVAGRVTEVEAPVTAHAAPSVAGAPDDEGGAVGWILLGTGIAAAVAGAVMLGVGQADVASATDVPVGTPWSDVSEAANRGLILSNAGWATLALGAALSVTGLVLLVVDLTREPEPRARTEHRWAF